MVVGGARRGGLGGGRRLQAVDERVVRDGLARDGLLGDGRVLHVIIVGIQAREITV
jgi:hypothetical protein